MHQAFKTESQNALYGQQVYPEPGQSRNEAGRDSLNQEAKERAMPPVNLPPRSPEKPANPEWLKVPLRDDERPSELGTPMVMDDILQDISTATLKQLCFLFNVNMLFFIDGITVK